MTENKLRDALEYDPLTGLFRWRYTPNGKVKAGSVAGSPDKDGYTRIRFEGRAYMAHRLAWLFMFGCWPPSLIDHVDGGVSNNRISNLRLASDVENSYNRKKHRNNTSGFRGVDFYRQSQRWRARIRVDGRLICIGLYDCPSKASEAYENYAKSLHGNFYRADHGLVATHNGAIDPASYRVEAMG